MRTICGPLPCNKKGEIKIRDFLYLDIHRFFRFANLQFRIMSFTVSHVSERWTGTKMVTSQRWKKLSPGWVQIYWRRRLVSVEYLICCFICFSSQGELKLAKKKLSMKEVDSVSDRAVSPRNIIETKAYSCHKTICKAIEWHWIQFCMKNWPTQAIKEYDLDKDGKLNYNEFLKSHAKKWDQSNSWKCFQSTAQLRY